MKRQLTTSLLACTMLFTCITPSMAAIEVDETDFGPSYETMVVDTVAGKPLQFIAAVAGTAAFVVSYPFSYAGGNEIEAQQKLVTDPWEALQRCLGCTVAEDNYYKSQAYGQNMVRIVVDQPSEIYISTDDNVVVLPQ